MVIGVQTPRVEWLPPAASHADADDAEFLCAGYGITPDPWQRHVLRAWLATDSDGRWAAARCGLALARQQGKSELLLMRTLYALIVCGERVLYSAHAVRSGQRMFMRLCDYFDNPRLYPKLHARTTTIRRANGQEAIVLDNGGSFELLARSRQSGRGFSADVLVLDEAQALTEQEMSALLPTISVSRNPQLILTGTPPSETSEGEQFARLRAAGLAGDDERLCWMEWSVEPGSDLDDVEAWRQANPALGIRLELGTVSDERAVLDDETFARERLGIWGTTRAHRVISEQAWQECADPVLAAGDGDVAVAVDVTPARDGTSIAAAGFTVDGLPYVDVIESRRGEPEWVLAKITELAERHKLRAVVVDGISGAATLADPLTQRGITVTTTSANQMAKACGTFYDAAVSGQLRHLDQPMLNLALAAARKRAIGDGLWGWSRKDSDSDISQLVAATLALWGLTSSEVKPPKRARSGKAMFV